MKQRTITISDLDRYRDYLIEEERSGATLRKYMHDVRAFYEFLGETKKADKESVLDFKAHLEQRYAVNSVNSMLIAVNGFLSFLEMQECRVKTLKMQRRFCTGERELTKAEYFRLIETAEKKQNQRLCAIMQTICATGIRISELSFVTVEAVKSGRAQVSCKGKKRVVIISKELQRLLLRYCAEAGIRSGCVFVTKTGKPVDRSNIWTEMKKLCSQAEVEPEKVFPHNLRHLFAVTFYRLKKDIAGLADVLGHSSIETTRIYTATSGDEHRSALSQMGLVRQGEDGWPQYADQASAL